MNHNTQNQELEQNNDENSQFPIGLTPEDIKILVNYPALGKLFDSDNQGALNSLKEKMNLTQQNLERVIRQGSKEDAENAQQVIESIKVVVNFLEMLEKMQTQ